jgi:hypothetical protein
MKAVCESKPSFGVEDCHKHNFKMPVVCLEHVRPLLFQTIIDPNFQLGALHSIDWAPSLDFLPHVLKLVCCVSGFDESNFTVTSLLRYQDGRHVAKPGVGIFANDGVSLDDEHLLKIDNALTSFCRSVLVGQEIDGQEQFFPVATPENNAEVVAKLVDDFLVIYSGKKVGETRLLKTRNREMLLAGTYRSMKDAPLPAPVRWPVTGEIDGLRGKSRTLYVNLTERKTIAVLFDEERFKESLRSRILDNLPYDFVIETEWIARDKTVDSLISFCRCDSGEAILV